MAEFWLPVDNHTPDKIEVRQIARQLGIDRHEAFGRLMSVWFWFNQHTVDGQIAGGELEDVDDVAGIPGFAAAMVEAKWLVISEQGLQQPGFNAHRRMSQKELSSVKRAAKSNSKEALLKQLAVVADDDDELVEWLQKKLPQLNHAPEAHKSCAKSAHRERRRERSKETPETQRQKPPPPPEEPQRQSVAEAVTWKDAAEELRDVGLASVQETIRIAQVCELEPFEVLAFSAEYRGRASQFKSVGAIRFRIENGVWPVPDSDSSRGDPPKTERQQLEDTYGEPLDSMSMPALKTLCEKAGVTFEMDDSRSLFASRMQLLNELSLTG